MSEEPVDKMSFEEAMRELETVVGRLESGDVPLEDSIRLYERGAALKAHCQKKLAEAEEKVASSRGTERGTRPGPRPSTASELPRPPGPEGRDDRGLSSGCSARGYGRSRHRGDASCGRWRQAPARLSRGGERGALRALRGGGSSRGGGDRGDPCLFARA